MLILESSPALSLSHAATQLDSPSHTEELNRLLSAAVVSANFRNQLLVDPRSALACGYQGESFNLSDEDRNWLLSARPTSLVDLAANLVVYQQGSSRETPVILPAKTPARRFSGAVKQ